MIRLILVIILNILLSRLIILRKPSRSAYIKHPFDIIVKQ